MTLNSKHRYLIPPEFIALARYAGPKIIGWTFQLCCGNEKGMYYSTNSNNHDYFTADREHAQVYSSTDILMVSRNKWNWGRKDNGRWRAVYE